MFSVKREVYDVNYSEGKMYQNGNYLCDTLEPSAYKGMLVKKGKYPMVISKSPKFKKWLPVLVGVKGRSGIRIHAGNKPKDTTGCILVGVKNGKGSLTKSRDTLEKVISRIQTEIAKQGVANIELK